MPIKGLECRDVIPGSQCKLLLVGEVEEITQAFAGHAAQRHATEAGFADEVGAKLLAAAFIFADKAHIGEGYTEAADGSISIDGSGS